MTTRAFAIKRPDGIINLATLAGHPGRSWRFFTSYREEREEEGYRCVEVEITEREPSAVQKDSGAIDSGMPQPEQHSGFHPAQEKVAPCCGYQYKDDDYPVMWNPWNKVAQCHNCGETYVPRASAPAPDPGSEPVALSSAQTQELLGSEAPITMTVDEAMEHYRHRHDHVAIVTNNNQPGSQHIIETAPNVTLDIGTKLYAAPQKPDYNIM